MGVAIDLHISQTAPKNDFLSITIKSSLITTTKIYNISVAMKQTEAADFILSQRPCTHKMILKLFTELFIRVLPALEQDKATRTMNDDQWRYRNSEGGK